VKSGGMPFFVALKPHPTPPRLTSSASRSWQSSWLVPAASPRKRGRFDFGIRIPCQQRDQKWETASSVLHRDVWSSHS